MQESIPIKTECHAGYKADEYPVCFYREDKRYEIVEVLDRWYQGDCDPAVPVSDYFKVRTSTGEQFILKHEIRNDAWYLLT